MANTIQISVLAETQKAVRALGQVNGSLSGIQKSVKSAGPAFKGMLAANVVGKGAQLAADGIRALTGVIGDSVVEARESQQVGATTAQIIKQTGGAAKISADQVGDLTTAISNKTGVDDEAVQKGANLLLTFKNVRNEAGKGADVFNRATGAAVDLSKAGFGSIDGASKMLGKALNDPIKGISALGRAGVTFTDQQKEQIKTMVQSGDVLGAQKIIMGEVESQVGGVAAASASAGDKFKVMTGNLKEQFGTILLPYLDKFLNFFNTTLGPAISKGLSALGPALQKVGALIGPVIDKLTGAFSNKSGGIGAYAASVIGALQKLAPIVVQVFGTIMGAVKENLPAIKAIFTDVGGAITAIANTIVKVWRVLGPVVIPIVKSVFGTIIQVVGGALKVVSGIIKTVTAIMTGDWRGAWNGIKQIVQGVFQIIKALVSNAINIIKTVVKAGVTALVNTIKQKLNDAVATVKTLPGKIKSALSNIGTLLIDAGRQLLTGFISGVRDKVGEVLGEIRDIAHRVAEAARSALDINSPSRVFQEIGKYTVLGLVKGLDGSMAERASAGLAKSLVSGFGSPLLTPQIATQGLSGASMGGATYNIYVTAGVGDPVAIGREVVRYTKAYRDAGGRG